MYTLFGLFGSDEKSNDCDAVPSTAWALFVALMSSEELLASAIVELVAVMMGIP